MVSIYEYLNYSLYLTDWVKAKKEEASKYSRRWVAQQLDCDPSFLGKVLSGKKPIPEKLKYAFVQLIRLQGQEREYFEHLIQLSRSRTPQEKKRHLDTLFVMRGSKIKTLSPVQYEYYSKWYYTAVLQVLDYYDFQGNYQELANQFDPPLKRSEAERAIEVLEKLGLIYKKSGNSYGRKDVVLSTGEGWESTIIANYQLENLKLSESAYEKFSSKARRFSTLTLSVSEKVIRKLMQDLHTYEMNSLAQAANDDQADRVYQMNFQIFPLSKIQEEE